MCVQGGCTGNVCRVVATVVCRVLLPGLCVGCLHWCGVQGGCHWLCVTLWFAAGCAYRCGCTGCVYRVVALVVCRMVALVVCRVVALVVRTGWLHWLCVGWLHWLCVGWCTGCV